MFRLRSTVKVENALESTLVEMVGTCIELDARHRDPSLVSSTPLRCLWLDVQGFHPALPDLRRETAEKVVTDREMPLVLPVGSARVEANKNPLPRKGKGVRGFNLSSRGINMDPTLS